MYGNYALAFPSPVRAINRTIERLMEARDRDRGIGRVWVLLCGSLKYPRVNFVAPKKHQLEDGNASSEIFVE